MNLYPPDPPLLPTITPHFALQDALPCTALMVIPQPHEHRNVFYPGEVALWDADTATEEEIQGSSSDNQALNAAADNTARVLNFATAIRATLTALFTAAPNTTAIVTEPAIGGGRVALDNSSIGHGAEARVEKPKNGIQLALVLLVSSLFI